MSNPFEACRAIVHALHPLSERYLEVEQAEQLQQELDKKVDAHNIEVMLFGAYNAGKSTLLNALLGRHAAAIADIPTTDHIDRYDWNGYVLLDSPGVNAPIEHEEVTQGQLQRCDLIMFVIREGDQDTRDVYVRLFQLLAEGKKVFVVLNYQDREALPESFAQVNALLSKLGAERNVDQQLLDQLVVLPVNADSAFRGRTENKPKLLAHSGYPVLLDAFNSWLQQYDSEHQRLSGLTKQVNTTLVAPLLSALGDGQAADDNCARLSATLRDLERRRQILRQSARNIVRHEVQLKRGEIGDVLSSTADVPAKESRLAAVAGATSDAVQAWLTRELEDMRVQVVQASFDAAGIDTRVTSADLKEGHLGELILDKAKDGLKAIDKEHIKDLLLWGRSLKIPGIKGRWGSTLDNWAGKIAPGLQIVLAVVDLFIAWRGQEKHNARQVEQARKLYAEVDRIVDVISTELGTMVDEVICEVLDESIAPLQANLDALTAQADAMTRDRETVRAAERSLAGLQIV
jgi:GTP-binding protein EngB required for normal cell division